MELNTTKLSEMTIAELDAIVKEAAKAKRDKKRIVKLPPLISYKISAEEYQFETVQAVTLVVPLAVRPSVENGYGKSIIADSSMGNTQYFAVGQLPNDPALGPLANKIVEGRFSFRVALDE